MTKSLDLRLELKSTTKRQRKEKENEKKRKMRKKAISQRGYGVDDAEEWSVEELLLD